MAALSAAPLSALMPDGISTASIGTALALAFSASAATVPSSGRLVPMPNSASISRAAPARSASPISVAVGAFHRAAARDASPVPTPSGATTATAKPRRRSRWAASSPSPPLLPGPANTIIRAPGGAIRAAWSATLAAAHCMRAKLSLPAANHAASAARIIAEVSKAGMAARWRRSTQQVKAGGEVSPPAMANQCWVINLFWRCPTGRRNAC